MTIGRSNGAAIGAGVESDATVVRFRVHDHAATTVNRGNTGGCNSFTHQSLLSAETDPFRLDSQFEFSRTYSHQYKHAPRLRISFPGHYAQWTVRPNAFDCDAIETTRK